MNSAADRRLAAILCGDVFGYSRLMEEDEDGTVRTLRAWREQIGTLIAEYRGRLVDFSGDNFLAEFPAARDAVACARDIQRVLHARNAGLAPARRMEFRIGAHLGDVRTEGDRLFGDGVNIAARLQTLAEPGGICLSAAMHEQVRNKLELDCEDLGAQTLKNISNPIHAYRLRAADAAAPVQNAREPQSTRRRTLALVSVLAIALAAIGVWKSWPQLLGLAFDAAHIVPGAHPALPDKPSIAVLPFTNMSGDAEQEYFADGITEELTTDLAQSTSLFVIARNSAFTYKGKAVKIEDVGRELGVRYVLEGSVRRAGERVRITAQLIEASNGFHVWGQQYDRSLDDVLAVQSEIAEQVFVATGAPIMEAELERIRHKPTDSFTAYDAYTKGLSLFGRFRVRDMAESRRWFERAVELDPGYAAAVSQLGATYYFPYTQMWDFDESALERDDEYQKRAMELDPHLWWPYFGEAALELIRGRFEQGRHLLDRTVELAPNEWRPRLVIAVVEAVNREPLRATESLQLAMRLNPHTTSDSLYVNTMAIVYDIIGRHDEAVRLCEQDRAENPDSIGSRLLLAAHYQTTDRHEEAHALIQEALQVNPALTTDALRHHKLNRARPDLEQHLAALRAAGLP